jgi:23S rRNA U2552 (ribose-2'-O)-methylase RlmE/FtsJ
MNVSAPAREAARTVSIANFDNLDKIPQIPVDFIVEVTGAQKVVDQLVRMVAEKNIQIITHDMAYIIMQVLEENNHRSSQLVS